MWAMQLDENPVGLVGTLGSSSTWVAVVCVCGTDHWPRPLPGRLGDRGGNQPWQGGERGGIIGKGFGCDYGGCGCDW